MKNKFYAVLCAVLMFGIGQTVYAQVDQGVTSSGKEVDCSTIDPSVDKTVNEHGKVVTSPRVTRNGKLITEECPTCDVDLSITDTVDCVSITLSAPITNGDPTSAILKVYGDAAHTSQVGSDIIAVISGGKITAVASDLNCHTRYYFVLETTDALGNCTFDWTDSTRDLTLEKVTTCTVSSALALSEGSDLSHEHLYAPGLIDSVYDHQGNRYAVVQIGQQCWLKENMRCTTAPPGGVTLVATNATTTDLQTPRYYYPTETRTDTVQSGHHYTPEEYVSVYGYLYNFPGFMAINSVPTDYDSYSSPHRGICPMGWHIPTDAEWNTLEKAVADNSSAIVSTGSRGTGNPRLVAGCDWITIAGTAGKNRPGDYSYEERNLSGFSALPAGNFYGGFKEIGQRAYFACATPVNGSTEHTVLHAIFHTEQGFYRNTNNMRYAGRSVRCVRDLRAMMTSTVPDSLYLCEGESESVTYTITHPSITGTGIAYKWYVDDVLQASATNTMTISYNAAGVHSVRCEVTKGAQSETGSKVTIVSTYALPTVSISGDFVVCRTTPVTLTATSGYTSYAWSSNVVSPSTVNTAQAVNAGTYTVTVTDANGCTNSASQEVTVNNPLVTSAVTISGDNSVCYDEGTTLTASATASTGATLTYQWYKNGIAISGATSNTLNTGNLTDASTTFKCEVKAEIDDCVSAASEASKVVTVNHPIAGTVSVSADATTLCNGGSTTVRASVTGNTGTLSYQWYLGSSAISGATSNTYNVTNIAATGTYTCEVTATVNGCTATADDDVQVVVMEPTTGTLSLSAVANPVCPGSATTINASVTGNDGVVTYAWAVNGTPSAQTSASLTTGALTASTLYACTATVTKDGCSASTSQSLTVNVATPPTVAISGDDYFCDGSNTTLTATGASTYAWSNSATTAAITVSSVGTYSVTGTDANGCTATASKVITKEAAPVVTINATPATAMCTGSNITLTASGANTYVWSTSATANTIIVSPSATTDYVVTGTASNGCSATASQTVTVNKPTLTLAVSGNDHTVCWNATSTILTAVTTGSDADEFTYEWTFDGTTVSTSASYDLGQLADTSDYTLLVTAKKTLSGVTCEVSKTLPVRVNVHPHNFPVDTTTLCDCDLPYYWYAHEYREADFEGRDTLTRTYSYTTIDGCPCDSLVTLILWSSNVESKTACTNIGIPVNTVASGRYTQEHLTGSTLESVEYHGYDYKVVQIGNQCWLKENLRTTKLPDGTPLTPIRSNSTQRRTYYAIGATEEIPILPHCGETKITFAEYVNRYGYVYNWPSALDIENPGSELHDVQGLCPDGWHIPDTTEWHTLEHNVGLVGIHTNTTNDYLGTRVVELTTGCEWGSSDVPNSPGDYTAENRNLTQFSARPAGCWYDVTNSFNLSGNHTYFWSSTRDNVHQSSGGMSAYNYDIYSTNSGFYRDVNGNDGRIGRSIRCLRDEEELIGNLTVNPHDGYATANYAITATGENGVCWSTSHNPTVSNSHSTSASNTAGSKSVDMSPLVSETRYYARAYVIVGGTPIYSDEVSFKVMSLPEVATSSYSAVSSTEVTLKGNLVDNGGYGSATCGICWGTAANPTVSDSHAEAGSVTSGEFSVQATGLDGATTYHYRAYATNAKGTVYGEDQTFVPFTCGNNLIDVEGNSYTTRQYDSQCWMTSSMHTLHYADGTSIGTSGDKTHYSTSDAYYYTPYDPANPTTDAAARIQVWGYLYNWAAATRSSNTPGAQGICPNGWHLPTNSEWEALNNHIVAYWSCNGGAARAMGATNTWRTDQGAACSPGLYPLQNNASGFNVYPMGVFTPNVGYEKGTEQCNFWTSSWGTYPQARVLKSNNSTLIFDNGAIDYRASGYAVRCVKDN